MAASLPLGGCPLRHLSLEQGLLNPCRSGPLSAQALSAVDQAWEGVRPAEMWDVHVHLFGNGRSGSGLHIDADLDRPRTPMGLARRTFFLNAGCAGDDDERVDERVVARLAQLADGLPKGAKLLLLAFDYVHDDGGRRRPDLTTFAVPDAYARRVAGSRPDRFEWIASIHPYRADAFQALEAARAGGARAVKWLPSSMGIDLADPRSEAFYEALARSGLPLLVHVGAEVAAPGAGREALGNPLFLRLPLERGVRVVAAHCATLGASPDLDRSANPDKAPEVPNFELFARLMAERRHEGRLFGELSAVTQGNRAQHLPELLTRREWEGRLLNGSDYPLPGIMPLFSLGSFVKAGLLDARHLPALRELREANPLLFDFVLKRRLENRGARFPASAFETRSFFGERAQQPAF